MGHFPDRSVFSTKNRIVGILVAVGWLIGLQPATAQDGKQIFQQACAACHSIGGGRLLGPDLAGVTEKRPEAWLIAYIKSQDAVLKSGDKTAQAIWDEYKIPMPDQALSEGEIKAVLAHIKTAGGAAAGQEQATLPVPTGTSAPELTPDEIQLGRQLFEGSVRFANGGPACNACHDINHPAVAGGGSLARDLTLSHSRMGKVGVNAMLTNAPFPVMRMAYEGKPLNAGEVRALVGFLQQAEKEHAAQAPRNHGWRMFFGGAGGVVVVLGFFALAGGRRKKRSVNQEIYDRQLKSE